METQRKSEKARQCRLRARGKSNLSQSMAGHLPVPSETCMLPLPTKPGRQSRHPGMDVTLSGTVFLRESDHIQGILLGRKGRFLVLGYHQAEASVEDYASGARRGRSPSCWLQLLMPFLVLMCRWVGVCVTCTFPLPAEPQGSSSREEGTRRRFSPFPLASILAFASPPVPASPTPYHGC